MNRLVWILQRWRWRLGTPGVFALLVWAVAMAIGVADVLPLHQDLARRERELAHQRAALERAPRATEIAGDAAEGELRFTHFLADFYQLAARHGVALPHVDYQVQAEQESQLQRHVVHAPIKAGYPALRAFLDELRHMRGVRLDSIVMSREHIGQDVLDIDLRFSYLVEVVP
jgi:hypothetical protein